MKLLVEEVKREELSILLECSLRQDDQKIGYAELYLIKGGEYLAGYLDQADHYSGRTPYDAMLSINFDGETGLTDNIAYLHNLYIYDAFRGKGRARYFINELEAMATTNGMETMILQPCPIGKNKSSYFSSTERLIELYEKYGYREYETKLTMRNPYFYKEITKVMIK